MSGAAATGGGGGAYCGGGGAYCCGGGAACCCSYCSCSYCCCSWADHRPACRRDTRLDPAVAVPATTAVRATPRSNPGMTPHTFPTTDASCAAVTSTASCSSPAS